VLTNEEAGLLLAKKLLAKRVVENLEPLYPFDRASVAFLNGRAAGNPRNLLKLADLALERAVGLRAYRVDESLAEAALLENAKAAPRRVVPLKAANPAMPDSTGPAAPSRPDAVHARPTTPR